MGDSGSPSVQRGRIGTYDLIAVRLPPLPLERDLIAAGRLLLREIEAYIRQRKDFAFKTTLGGRSYLKLVRRMCAEGWRVELIYRVQAVWRTANIVSAMHYR
jgi:predicted ABC-type ATPase